ncbi:MAG: metallophosphoesterase family protein [Roseobacter sp.]
MHQDLGTIDETVLLFGGPYSNFQATSALFEQADVLGIPNERTICTGDVVAYAADPIETIAAIRARDIVVVAGNCEKQLGQGALECGCGFEEGSACDLMSAGWFGYANKQIVQDDRTWMRQCPDVVSFRHCGERYAVIHGGVTDIARFIWSTSPQAVFDAEWSRLEAQIGPVNHVLSGHCGIPFVRDLNQGRWINAGVIGMPPHDGACQTRFAVLEAGAVQIRSLEYDVEGAFQAMVDAGLTQGYHTGLRSGYWPSEDVLPTALRSSSLANG